jgi:hypothetical protein
MRHFQQHVSQIFLFGNTKTAATQIHDAEAIILIVSKHSFHGHNIHYSYLMDPFIYKLRGFSPPAIYTDRATAACRRS